MKVEAWGNILLLDFILRVNPFQKTKSKARGAWQPEWTESSSNCSGFFV